MDVAANPRRAGGEPGPGWRRTRLAHARADAGLGGERRWLTLVPRGPPAAPERRGPTMVHRQQHSSDMDQSWSIVSSTRATWTNHMVHRQLHSSDMDQPWSIVSSTRATWTNHGPSSAAPERRRPRWMARTYHRGPSAATTLTAVRWLTPPTGVRPGAPRHMHGIGTARAGGIGIGIGRCISIGRGVGIGAHAHAARWRAGG